MAGKLYIKTDNLISVDSLKNMQTGAYVNDATITMSLFQQDTLNPDVGNVVSEVQTLTPDAPATVGNFTLSYKGQTTANIAHDATLAAIKTALELLSTVEADDIVASGDTLDTAPTAEVQTLAPNAVATAGTFTLTYEGDTTNPIAYNAAVADVKKALEGLTTVLEDEITVGGDPLSTGDMTFTFAAGLGDVSLMTCDGSLLTGPTETEIVETTPGHTPTLIFTFANTLGDTPLIEFDFTGLTGPTNADSTIVETTKGVYAGVAVDESGGKVGIPILGHTLTSADYVRLSGFQNYDGEYAISSVVDDKILITAAYVAEVFKGTEVIYVGIKNGTNINIPLVGGDTEGNYKGILPDTLIGLIERAWYFLFIDIVKDTINLTAKLKWKATYHATES